MNITRNNIYISYIFWYKLKLVNSNLVAYPLFIQIKALLVPETLVIEPFLWFQLIHSYILLFFIKSFSLLLSVLKQLQYQLWQAMKLSKGKTNTCSFLKCRCWACRRIPPVASAGICILRSRRPSLCKTKIRQYSRQRSHVFKSEFSQKARGHDLPITMLRGQRTMSMRWELWPMEFAECCFEGGHSCREVINWPKSGRECNVLKGKGRKLCLFCIPLVTRYSCLQTNCIEQKREKNSLTLFSLNMLIKYKLCSSLTPPSRSIKFKQRF